MLIGDRIAIRRKQLGLTQDELAARMGYKSKAAISKIETNVNDIAQSTVIKFAKALDTSVAYLMGWEEEVKTADPLRASAPAPREIDPIYDALNASGQKELCRYGRYLGTQDEYKSDGKVISFGTIPHFFTAAAAGYVAPIEGEEFEMVERDEHTPPGADFCIEIDGDSMEPYIKNGQRIFVKRDTTDMHEFDVGVFYVDGDVLCKQWCRDYVGTLHLLSANPKREDANRMIPRSSGSTVICYGKVLLPKRLPRPEYRRR